MAPWGQQGKTGFAISLKGSNKSVFLDAETALKEDINFKDNGDDTINIKLLNAVLQLPSIQRFLRVEAAQAKFLTTEAYLANETKQDATTKQLLDVVDAKDLDITEFTAALLKLVPKAAFVVVVDDLEKAKAVIADLKEQNVILRRALALCVVAEMNFQTKPARIVNPIDGSLGWYGTGFQIPEGLEVHCMRIQDNGIGIPSKDTYQYAEKDGVCAILFIEDAVNEVSNLDIAVSFKKKMILDSI